LISVNFCQDNVPNLIAFNFQVILKIIEYIPRDRLQANYKLWKDGFILICGHCEDADIMARLIESGADLVGDGHYMPLFEALKSDKGRSNWPIIQQWKLSNITFPFSHNLLL
jgi:hypothetical protein